MKKLTVIFTLALALSLFGVIGQAQAATTDTITVTVSLIPEIFVSLDETAWNIGPIPLSTSTDPETFRATVGNSATRLEIKGSNGLGTWVIGTPPGPNQFEVAVDDPDIKLTTSYQELAASVSEYGYKDFDLTYSSPTSDNIGAGVDQSFTVTVKAMAP